MKSIFNKTASFAAAAVALVIGGAMAGLGLAMLAVLAMFALAVVGLALLAAPFAQMRERRAHDIEGTLAGEEDPQTA